MEAFLRELNKYYEIVIFTASQSYYANEVLNVIDPSNELITFRLFREHCYVNERGLLIKDLNIIKNRDLANMVIVDNASYAYGYHFENGIPIVPFFDDKADDELHHLMNYLLSLAGVSDVRDFIKYDFCVDLFTKYSSDSQLLLHRLAEIKKV